MLLVGVLSARPLRDLWERRAGVVRLDYDERRSVAQPTGLTILEMSRIAGIPHASVCGGRGRCSTCRVRIGGRDRARLPPPSPEEQKVLARVGAPANVRLACQLRPPPGHYRVTPLLPASAGPVEAYRRQPQAHGGEHYVAILFADIRGFTSISEGKLPYDVVFLLNRYFRADRPGHRGGRRPGRQVHRRRRDGDLRPRTASREVACRQALDAARRMALALDDLNEAMSGDLDQPLRIGIGLHAGPTIVGEMGYERATQLTAIGDTVNTASRLETLTKEFGVELVVSQELLDRAGIDLGAYESHDVEIRGRQGRLAVRAVKRASRTHGNVIRISLLGTTRRARIRQPLEVDHAPDRSCRRRRCCLSASDAAFAAGGGADPPKPVAVDARSRPTRTSRSAKAMIEAKDYNGAHAAPAAGRRQGPEERRRLQSAGLRDAQRSATPTARCSITSRRSPSIPGISARTNISARPI